MRVQFNQDCSLVCDGRPNRIFAKNHTCEIDEYHNGTIVFLDGIEAHDVGENLFTILEQQEGLTKGQVARICRTKPFSVAMWIKKGILESDGLFVELDSLKQMLRVTSRFDAIRRLDNYLVQS